MKTKYNYKAEAKTINIDGEIDNFWGVGLSALRYDLQDAEDLTIYINSGGGSVTEGFAIADTLRLHGEKYNVEIIGVGIVASIATMILSAGSKGSRKMTENSFLMIHNPYAGIVGESKELRSTANTLDAMRERLIENYMQVITSNGKTTSREQIEAWMNEEKFFSAQEALEVGLIDGIVSAVDYVTPENVKDVEEQIKGYQRPPVALMNMIKEAKSMTEEFTKEETNIFTKFVNWLSKQFGNSVMAEKHEEEEMVSMCETCNSETCNCNNIDNMKNSDTMEKEELIKKLSEIGYELEPEKEKEEMSEEELLKMAEEMGLKPMKKAMKEEEKSEMKEEKVEEVEEEEEVMAENKFEAMLKAQAEEIARLKAAQSSPKINTETKVENKNKTRSELAAEKLALESENILNSWGEKYFN